MPASAVTTRDENKSSGRSAHLLFFASVLALLTILAYAPTFGAGFIWDDDAYVTQNPVLRSFTGLLSAWVPGVTPQYYPIVFTTFWLEYHLWGLNPTGYHLVNVLLHLTNALLVWRLARELRIPGAYPIALIFALHPMHVESVAWVTERKNVLSLLFYLIATRAYLRFDELYSVRSNEHGASRRYQTTYAVALSAFVAALLSKTVTASLPVALVLMMLWRGAKLTSARLSPLLPMLVLGAAAGLHTAYLERFSVGAVGPDFEFSLVERLLIATRAFLFYPAKLIVPWPLIFTYPRWQLHAANPSSWLPALLCIAALAGATVAWQKGARGVVLGIVFYAVTIFPALGFSNFYPMRFSFVADHFVYHASLGLIASAVGGFAEMLKNRVVARALLAAMVMLFATLTFRQTFMYADEATVWQWTLDQNPNATAAHDNLAAIAINGRNFALGEYHSREAIRQRSDDYLAYINLAKALKAQGKTTEAVQQLDRALDVLDRLIELHEAAGLHDRIDWIWTLKSDVILTRSQFVRSTDNHLDLPAITPELK